ncbi:hypothetical protein [Leifsonia sp. Root227]|uniref:hypothetical protein n=1 Tax=Leifsonia sp. Root227 TaxID=1736496 RepID=UPI0012F8527A|nr:hypothetical protein [Leifsonia sp. Root227]
MDTIGNALILELLFVVYSIPVVTSAPAAIALQRQLGDLRSGGKTGARQFTREFAAAWRSAWPVGLAVPLVTLGLAVGIPFWYSTGPWLGTVAMIMLVCLAGMGLAFWLAFLWAADAERTVDRAAWRKWVGMAAEALLHRSGRVLWGLVLFVTWLALAAYFLPALIIGAGLAPAAIVLWTLCERRVSPLPGDHANRS